MEVYKRKDGRSPFWHVDLVDKATGARVRKSTGQTDIKAARKVAQELFSKLSSTVRETTVGEALDAYIGKMQADRCKSWPDARAKADKVVGKISGKPRFKIAAATRLSDLSGARIQALKNARAAEGNSPGTIAAELRVLRAACKLAEGLGFVPATVLKWGVPPPERRLRYLSAAEGEVVLAHLTPGPELVGLHKEMAQDVHDLFLALVLTGGRWNEIATLTWRQIDHDRGAVTLFGWKGDKERTVPMVPEVAEMFARRATRPRGPYIFPGRAKADGKVGQARSGPCRAIARAMDKVGLNDPAVVEAFGRATIHSLRHTYASWLRQRGLALDEIQPLLGHADISTTQIYAKIVKSDTLDKARAALMMTRSGGEVDP